MIAAAVVRNAVVLNLAAVSVSNAVIHAVTNAAVTVVDMDMVMDMDTVTDLDSVDVLGFGLFLYYSSAVADGASAEDLEEDMVIQVSSNI